MTEAEVERYRQLGELTTQMIESVCRGIHPGEREFEIAGRLHQAAVQHGARLPVCLVAADERIQLRRHPLPTDKRMRRQGMLVVCVEKHGLICSASRLVHFGAVDDDLRRRTRAVCQIDAAAMAGTIVGRTIGEIFQDMVEAYRQTGFADEWCYHHQGGATGYQPRDLIAGSSVQDRVQANQAFAWNPSIAGAKSEDTILATTQSVALLTTPGADWPVLTVERGGGVYRRPDILVR